MYTNTSLNCPYEDEIFEYIKDGLSNEYNSDNFLSMIYDNKVDMEEVFINNRASYDTLFDFISLYSSKYPRTKEVINDNLKTKIVVCLQNQLLGIIGYDENEFSSPRLRDVFKIHWELVISEVEKWLDGDIKSTKLSYFAPYYADFGEDYLVNFYNTIRKYCDRLFPNDNYRLITNGYNVYIHVDEPFDKNTCLTHIFDIKVMYNDCR